MELLTGPVGWMVVGFVGAMFTAWLKGFFKQFLPSPQRARLALANAFKARLPLPEKRFRLVLCWLGNDSAGCDTGTVAEAFTSIDGIELIRSARVVSASGAADNWRPAMRKSTLTVLKTWNADVAVVGSVKDPGKALNLWFVPREGNGTLRRGDLPYVLVHVTLPKDFHDDLRAQLTAEALRVAAPVAGTEMRGRVLEKGLNGVTEKIAALLKGGAVESARRASLHMVLGNALATLGERERGPERLEQAVAAYTEALKERTRERVPLDWAMTQSNLGNAPSLVPLDWAMTQSNLGNALVKLGERERGLERLEQAVAAYTEALKERTRERVPLEWAMTQSNLGAALVTLGKREGGPERLEQAVTACAEALEERTRARVPLDWATTQSNLGAALAALGERERGPERLEQAVAVYTEALKDLTRARVPLDWAMVQNNLGAALVTLGKREGGPERLEQAVAAFTEALKERTRERVPLNWATTQSNLGAALVTLGKREGGQSALSRPWPRSPRRSRSAPASGCPSTGQRRRTTSAPRPWVSGREGQSTLSRPWPRSPRRSKSAPVRWCPLTGQRRRTTLATPSRSCVSVAERFERPYDSRELTNLRERMAPIQGARTFSPCSRNWPCGPTYL